VLSLDDIIYIFFAIHQFAATLGALMKCNPRVKQISDFVSPTLELDAEELRPSISHEPLNLPRRRAVITLATAIPSIAMAESATPSFGSTAKLGDVNVLIIECPKDGVVSNVNWTSAEIKRGTIICEIDPDDEDRAMDRIDLANQLLLLEANLLDPKNVAVRRGILGQGSAAAAKNEELAKLAYDEINGKYQAGVAVVKDWAPAGISLARAKADHAKALASLKLFDFNIEQARKRLELYKRQIPKEQAFLAKRVQRLKITAPADGVVTFLVGPNSFVEKGHPVATLKTSGPRNAIG
jgi:hypothetical protein